MLGLFSEPFGSALVRQALIAGLLATVICAVVGTWVVLRGATFLGDAMAHGVLPGVALASVLGGNIVFGALVAALAMAYGVSALGTSTRLSPDTTIGLLLVGMLALGVIVVSHSRSFATDLTALLFGDVLAATPGDIVGLTVALLLVALVVFVGRRAFVAAAFDVRKATTLGLRPTVALATLTVLMALAIVASFQVVGTLLMLGLLVAPPAAAILWARSIPRIMLGATMFGAASVVIGLVVSWHAATAGGATIAITAVAMFFLSLMARVLVTRVRAQRVAVAAAAVALGLAGCGTAEPPPAPTGPTSPSTEPEGAEGNLSSPEVVELDGAPTRLIVADTGNGAVEVIDALDETTFTVGEFGPTDSLTGDGRFGYLIGPHGVSVVDSGAWTYEHGDHNHYYAKPPSSLGEHAVDAVAIAADTDRVALRSAEGSVQIWDREWLVEGEIRPLEDPRVDGAGVAVPYGDVLIVAKDTGELLVVDDAGSSTPMPVRCAATGGVATTRSAVVLSCRDGAVRVSGEEAIPEATTIAFPAGQTPALEVLNNRGREGTVVGVAGDQVWALDSTAAAWSTVQVPAAIAANSAGNEHILVLTRDGVLRTFSLADGSQTAQLQLFAGAISSDSPVPVIEVDSDRAYVNDAAARAVYEIDYRDGLRLARTLRTSVAPDLMVEAGR